MAAPALPEHCHFCFVHACTHPFLLLLALAAGNTPMCRDLGNAFRPLAALASLTRLSLVGCWLRALPHQLASLSRLADLSLGGNEPLGQGSGSSLQPLSHLGGSLTQLDLSYCGLVVLPPELAALTQLCSLDVRGHPRLGSAVALGPLLGLPSLTHVDLRGCSVPAFSMELLALAEQGVALRCG